MAFLTGANGVEDDEEAEEDNDEAGNEEHEAALLALTEADAVV